MTRVLLYLDAPKMQRLNVPKIVGSSSRPPKSLRFFVFWCKRSTTSRSQYNLISSKYKFKKIKSNFRKSKFLIKKFSSKIAILVNNRNFGEKLLFWLKIVILTNYRHFDQKSEFWSKIEMLVENRNFSQKSQFWSKITILVKNRNFGQKS